MQNIIVGILVALQGILYIVIIGLLALPFAFKFMKYHKMI